MGDTFGRAPLISPDSYTNRRPSIIVKLVQLTNKIWSSERKRKEYESQNRLAALRQVSIVSCVLRQHISLLSMRRQINHYPPAVATNTPQSTTKAAATPTKSPASSYPGVSTIISPSSPLDLSASTVQSTSAGPVISIRVPGPIVLLVDDMTVPPALFNNDTDTDPLPSRMYLVATCSSATLSDQPGPLRSLWGQSRAPRSAASSGLGVVMSILD
mmetsp:Transcript_4113/g.8089  ORF Transcript_4113/g.8089 Transcript_4113/m.8089 type:complete len:215 (-) Transcript_4113:236-880(-)